MFTVIQTDRGASDREVEDGVFDACGLDVEFRRLELVDEDDLIAACGEADALIPAYVPLTARVLDALPRCRIVALLPLEADCDALLAAAFSAAGCAPLEAVSADVLQDNDWVRESQRQFTPIRAGERLWIVPTWHESPDPDAINLILDPGLAFGTGSHPTTRLVLAWLEREIRGGESVLDYGCGLGHPRHRRAEPGRRPGSGRGHRPPGDPDQPLQRRAEPGRGRILSARPPGHSARASATRSAWPSRRRSSPRCSTDRAMRSSGTTPTSSPPPAI